MSFIKKLFIPLSILAMATGFWGCVDLEFDEPEVPKLADIAANATIAEVKALHTIGLNDKLIEDSLVIEGVVVMDDESGNFYKQIAIQDETGGILIRLNTVGLSDIYPVGRQLFVKLKGLYIGDYEGTYQINGSPDEAIEEVLIDQFIIPGALDQPVVPTVLSVGELQNPATLDRYLSTLIQLENVEFAVSELGQTYADAIQKFSENRTVVNCIGEEVILRSSGFADFAGVEVAEGNGTVTAVLSVFRDTRQLAIRDTDDVDFPNERCSGSGNVGGDPIGIAEIRSLFNSGTTSGPNDKKIVGIVISDKNTANVVSQNLFLQDATGGIVVRFADDHNFELGEEIEVSVAGQTLSEYNGLLQVDGVPLGAAKSNGAGTLPTPREATVAEILSNAEAWESTLIHLDMAQITGGGTFSGSLNVVDASGSISMFTRSGATFADSPVPGGTVEVTAIVSDFNGAQILVRDPGDVVGGMVTEPESMDISDLRDAFTGVTTSAPLSRKIRGVVISDKDAGNINNQNVIIQDGTAGILVRFTSPHNFALGEDVEVVVSGQELSEYFGLLQVNNVPLSNSVSFGNGTLPNPRVATVQEILDNVDEWESTLVQVNNVTLSGASTFAGNLTVTDASGSITMFTRNSASFANTAVPGGAVNLIAVVSDFDGTQLSMRNGGDVQ